LFYSFRQAVLYFIFLIDMNLTKGLIFNRPLLYKRRLFLKNNCFKTQQINLIFMIIQILDW